MDYELVPSLWGRYKQKQRGLRGLCDGCVLIQLPYDCSVQKFEQGQKAMRAKRELDLQRAKKAEEEKRREVLLLCRLPYTWPVDRSTE